MMMNLPEEVQKKIAAQFIAKAAIDLLFLRMDAEAILIQLGCEKEKAVEVIEKVLAEIAADFEKNIVQKGYKPQTMIIFSEMKC